MPYSFLSLNSYRKVDIFLTYCLFVIFYALGLFSANRPKMNAARSRGEKIYLMAVGINKENVANVSNNQLEVPPRNKGVKRKIADDFEQPAGIQRTSSLKNTIPTISYESKVRQWLSGLTQPHPVTSSAAAAATNDLTPLHPVTSSTAAAATNDLTPLHPVISSAAAAAASDLTPLHPVTSSTFNGETVEMVIDRYATVINNGGK